MPGASELRLARNLSDPERYISVGDRNGVDAVRSCKSSPEFRERMARVREHVAEFQPDELSLVATASHGAVRVSP
jgi:hypothetical protein